jgi:hypothetical protein
MVWLEGSGELGKRYPEIKRLSASLAMLQNFAITGLYCRFFVAMH